jgi:tetratricopeptide (TPR) repeat protein
MQAEADEKNRIALFNDACKHLGDALPHTEDHERAQYCLDCIADTVDESDVLDPIWQECAFNEIDMLLAVEQRQEAQRRLEKLQARDQNWGRRALSKITALGNANEIPEAKERFKRLMVRIMETGMDFRIPDEWEPPWGQR